MFVFLKIDNNIGLLKQLEKVFTNDFFMTLNFSVVRFAICEINFWYYFIAVFFYCKIINKLHLFQF